MKITISGDPMGKQRPKVAVLGTSKYAHAYTPKETVNYESRVVHEFKQIWTASEDKTYPFEPGEEIYATITAYFALQKTHYKKKGINAEGLAKLEGKINPMKAPDCDNIAKICLDALNGLAYKDDSQITCLLVMKKYSETPRVEICLERSTHYGN